MDQTPPALITGPATGRPRLRLARRLGQPALVVGIACAAMAAVFLAVAAVQGYAAQRLAREGVQATATVTDRQITERRRTNGTRFETYAVTLAFTTAEGTPTEARSQVDRARYETLTLGTPLALTYAASDPALIELEPGATARRAAAIGALALLPLVMALVCGIWGLRENAAMARAARMGEARVGRVSGHKPVGRRGQRARITWQAGELSGRSLSRRSAQLPPVGRALNVYIDPRTGRGWWEGDY